MMDTSEYNRIKQEVLNRPICYRELEANNIIALGEDFYDVGSTTLKVTPQAAGKIDKFIGIKSNQTRIAKDSYGEEGLVNLRNFFGQAKKKKEGRIVLAADTQARQVVSATPIKDRLIVPEAFFSFAEMFMDKNQYLPERVEYNIAGTDTISILMRPVTEKYMEFAKGDEFMYNGLYLLWAPGDITLGNYYIRLVCTNGTTQLTKTAISKITSPSIEEFNKLLSLTADSDPIKMNIQKMLSSARSAMHTKASVRELGTAVSLLMQQGLEDEEANQIIPYLQTKNQYKDAGYETDNEHMALAKSDKTMWEIFNMLTAFATHNKIWLPQDIKRSSLMESSMDLLLRERDIKEYSNIF